MRSEVVLPAPLGPRKPVTTPGSIRAEKSETAVTAPKRLVTRENSSTCPSGMPNLSSSDQFPLSLPIMRAGDHSAPGAASAGLAGTVALMAQSRILARVHRGVGHLTLNRPEALNALDLGMIRDLTTALEGWRDDPEVRVILLDGAGERGLCAGGDVR